MTAPSEKIPKRIWLILISCMLILLTVVLQTWIEQEPVKQEQLTVVDGTLERLELQRGGRSGGPHVRLQLLGQPYPFIISRNAYQAIDVHLLRERVQPGSRLRLRTKTKSLERSQEGGLLKKVLPWRKYPQVITLETENKVYLTLEQYNAEAQASKSDQRFWGGVLVIIFVLLVYNAWRAEKNKPSVHKKR